MGWGWGGCYSAKALFFCLFVCLCRVYTAAAAAVTQCGQQRFPIIAQSAGLNHIGGGSGVPFHISSAPPPISPNKRDPFHPLSTFRSSDSLP